MRDISDHIAADMYLLGYSDPAIHELLDAAVKYLGPAHRWDKHNVTTIQAVEYFFGKKAADVALLHILLDSHIIDDNLVMKTIQELKNG